MASNQVKVLGAIVVLIVAGAGAYQVTQKGSGASPPPPPGPPPGPPANAEFLPVGHKELLGAALSTRPRPDQEIGAEFYGMWVPSDGWEGEASVIETEDGTQVISMFYGSASAISEYWVVCRMSVPVQVEKHQRIWVQGRLSYIERRIFMANVRTEIVLDQARLVTP